jgi:hypothetical protein
MVAKLAANVEENREAFVAELTESALGVARKHGAQGPSIVLEIRLWKSLGGALRDRAHREGLEKADHRWEERLADLTDVAYRVLLQHRFHDNFIHVQIDLREAFRHVIRRRRFLPANTSTESIRLSGVLAIH